MSKKDRFGFTLFEILIVVTIIGVLAALSLTAYSTAQRRTRDTKRKGDLKSISNALEQYYAICTYVYPLPAAQSKVPEPIQCGSNTIMATVPKDPRSGTKYTMTGDGTYYSICAPNNPPLETESGAYCLSNQQ